MKDKFNTLWQLSIASIKMYFRNFTAVFFSLIFPVIFLLVFGFISSGGDLSLSVALYNQSENQVATDAEKVIREVPVLEFREDDFDDIAAAKKAVGDGDINFVVVLGEEFGEPVDADLAGGQVDLYINEAEADFNQTFESLLTDVLSEFNDQATLLKTGSRPLEVFTLNTSSVQSSELGNIDYVAPGIIAFSILSLGIFSIAQGFVTYKANGSLRRFFVTPVGPLSFILAQSVARLIMTVINVWTMILISMVLFDFQMVGGVLSFINFTIIAVLGAVLFLGIGFAVAGWAKDENQAAPVANIIFFPMMFLSGTFFPRELFPDWLVPITDFIPLSYLGDALRLVANEAAGLASLWPEILGMSVWIVIVYFIAVKVFRWE